MIRLSNEPFLSILDNFLIARHSEATALLISSDHAQIVGCPFLTKSLWSCLMSHLERGNIKLKVGVIKRSAVISPVVPGVKSNSFEASSTKKWVGEEAYIRICLPSLKTSHCKLSLEFVTRMKPYVPTNLSSSFSSMGKILCSAVLKSGQSYTDATLVRSSW